MWRPIFPETRYSIVSHQNYPVWADSVYNFTAKGSGPLWENPTQIRASREIVICMRFFTIGRRHSGILRVKKELRYFKKCQSRNYGERGAFFKCLLYMYTLRDSCFLPLSFSLTRTAPWKVFLGCRRRRRRRAQRRGCGNSEGGQY